MGTIAIGVDIGGSHIYCAAVDLKTHRIIPGTGHDQKINNAGSAGEILDGWSAALAATIRKIDRKELVGIGFAMPGPFDYANGIALFEGVNKYDNLSGVDITQQLRERLQLDDKVRLRYINDATAFAIAESWIGMASNYNRVLALTLGTGFGSAFIERGIPVLDGDTVPETGCVWHIRYEEGIANDYFSTRWFTWKYFNKTGILIDGVKEIVDSMDKYPVGVKLFEEFGTNMGEFLAPWIMKFNAEVIVMGGNISGSYDLFGNHLIHSLKSNSVTIEVLVSELKEDAAVIGAARLLVEDYWDKVKDLLDLM